jgi:hypothetical protein
VAALKHFWITDGSAGDAASAFASCRYALARIWTEMAMSGHKHCTEWYTTFSGGGILGPLHRRYSPHLRPIDVHSRAVNWYSFLQSRRTNPPQDALRRRQVVDADLRIHVQEVRALHTAAANGGMRVAVRLPGMRHAAPRVLLTAPGHLTMSADARQAGAKYERNTDGLHDRRHTCAILLA